MDFWKRREWIVAFATAWLLFIAYDARAESPVMPGVPTMENQMMDSQIKGTKDPKQLFLDGDARLACECLLCLAAGTHPPKECHTALTKYYLIQAGTPFHTMVLRRNFLQLCPKQ